MKKAIAIAVVQNNPFKAAAESIKNCGAWLANFMYGTEDRVRITYAFALALLALAYSMSLPGNEFAVCAN